ncbi:lytic murein transglycosylase [Gallaecimonas sp. GXIMD4217]|uniref:lytic murein transglycosylase n=1 Tax=Gallaecimonas sp. GXIMD4217 TaxID=3131927 RepID=UPI00311AD456
MARLLALAALLLAQGVLAKPDFAAYVQALKVEAAGQGISQATLDAAFADVRLMKKAIKADRNQPEFKLTLEGYLAKTLPEWKVKLTRQRYLENREQIEAAARRYGVQGRFLAALWAKESSFGKIQGNFPVVSALASMAYEGRREAFFKKELMAALQILDEGHIDLADFKGSWAGAMGQTQFMPSSFLAFAADGDGDGKKDIWNNKADVFASMANYLAQSGWQGSETWGRQVRVPAGFDWSQVNQSRSLADWQALGVRRMNGRDLPRAGMQAQFKAVDGEKGRLYLVYNNYQVLKRWNRSDFFATAVGVLADRVAWPPLEAK